MMLEITCEVRERHTRIPRNETFTVAAESLEDVEELIAKRFPGKWCVHPKARIIDVFTGTPALDEFAAAIKSNQFNRTVDGIATLERHGVDIAEVERQAMTIKRKPGRPRKNG